MVNQVVIFVYYSKTTHNNNLTFIDFMLVISEIFFQIFILLLNLGNQIQSGKSINDSTLKRCEIISNLLFINHALRNSMTVFSMLRSVGDI